MLGGKELEFGWFSLSIETMLKIPAKFPGTREYRIAKESIKLVLLSG
jgi:hypothetical protein